MRFFNRDLHFERVSLCGEFIVNAMGFAFRHPNYNAGIKYADTGTLSPYGLATARIFAR
jgi:hypothetical protein